MLRIPITALAAVAAFAGTLAAQNFDTSGNGQLNGAYFVREVLIAGQNSNGTITAASSVIGTLNFDGKGGFTFSGQVTASNTGVSTQSLTGTYSLAGNGLFVMSSLAAKDDVCYGVVSGIGPSAIVASATEGDNTDMLVAIPAGTGVTNASLRGAYTAGYLDFTSANIAMTREAQFNFTSDGAGNLGTIAATGAAVNLNNGAPTNQNVANVTYALAGSGTGTINLGIQSPTQLVSGTKTLFLSADGNILLGGNPAGFDMFVGIKGLSGTASNATANSLYFTAALEYFVDPTNGSSVDAFYGSANANGKGTTLSHERLKYPGSNASDYTFDNEYTVQPTGTIGSNDIPYYSYTFGVGGKAYIATGTQGLYSLHIGFAAPTYTGTGVFINPTGVVNAANFAPITNPVAPNEVVTLFGSGLASGTVSASALPLPTTLGGVQVTVNGIPAPLFYVSAGQIAFLVPPTIGPQFNGPDGKPIANATIQVINNGAKSNQVTVYTQYTAPGIFSTTGSGVGTAAATHVNGSLITKATPAAIGETVVVYVGGLGTTTPSVPSGGPSPASPPAVVDDSDDTLDFGGTLSSIQFSGLTPGLSGLYQMNAKVGPGTPLGNDYVNLQTPDAYSSQTTAYISGASTAQSVMRHPEARRPRPSSLSRGQNRPGLKDRAR